MTVNLQEQENEKEFIETPSNSKKFKVILIFLSFVAVAGVTGYALTRKTVQVSEISEIQGTEVSVPTSLTAPKTKFLPVALIPIKHQVRRGTYPKPVQTDTYLKPVQNDTYPKPVQTDMTDTSAEESIDSDSDSEIYKNITDTEHTPQPVIDTEKESTINLEPPILEPKLVAIDTEHVHKPLEKIVISDVAKEFANMMISTDRKLKKFVDSGDFSRARKKCRDLLLRHDYRGDGDFKDLEEQVIEEVYKRAFKNYIDAKSVDHLDIVVKVFADEAMRRDEELKELVLSGKFGLITEYFLGKSGKSGKHLRLNSIIQNQFFKYRTEILAELIARAKLNSPDAFDDLDFEALASEAVKVDHNLASLVSRGCFSEVKKQFMTKTLKLFGTNSKMNEGRLEILEVLTKRAEDRYISPNANRDGFIGADLALDLDPKLKELVESGQFYFVQNHFLNFTLNIVGLDQKVTNHKGLVLEELIQRAEAVYIQMRNEADKASKLNFKNNIAPKSGKKIKKRVTINPEATHVYLIPE